MAESNATKSKQQGADQGRQARESGQGELSLDYNPTTDLMEYCKQYARQKPEMAALWCFGIGFVLGWKLKPW